MGALALNAADLGVVQKSLEITDLDFGYRYGSFRSVDRFLEQLSDTHVGLITWPGGSLSEKDPSRYGFNFDGLFNPALDKPGLAEMFAIAREEGVGLSVVLPTVRYDGNDATLRTDVRDFMGKVLSGHYGTPPEHLQFEVGNEWYCVFGNGVADAQAYGHVANIYVEEIAAALNNPAINVIGADISIAVQSGRSMAEDEAIRSEFQGDHLAEVDLVTHHRFAFTAVGVDKSVDEIGRILDAWEADARDVGGDRPALFLGAYNVGSLTREEALDDYIKAEAADGNVIERGDIDLAGRSDTDFERFWQASLAKRDYGAEHPRLLLENFAEYGGEGMGAAATYGSDMSHSGRLSTEDTYGNPQHFVGQDMLDMLGESTVGTRVLNISLGNDRGDSVWTYAFESEDKLVVFLSADKAPPGKMTISIEGLGTTYKAVYGDSLTSKVPADWMERFGVPDNPEVDETTEGKGYAIGVREAATPVVTQHGVTVDLDKPFEVIRLSFAKSDAGLYEIEGYSEDQGVELAGPLAMHGFASGAGEYDPLGPASLMSDLPDLQADDQSDVQDESADGADAGSDFGAGGLILALLPFLFLL